MILTKRYSIEGDNKVSQVKALSREGKREGMAGLIGRPSEGLEMPLRAL
jgi:hypothetical protein